MAVPKKAQTEKFRNDLSAAFVKSLLDYNPTTGIFHWKPKPAGTKVTSGHLNIKIAGKWYGAHRLAWLYMTGEWPENLIDHKNRDPSDNRFENLRNATRSDNACNRTKYQSTSGYKGVTWDKKHSRWRAQITIKGKPHKLGRFDTPEEAHAAYCAAAKILHGDFARFE